MAEGPGEKTEEATERQIERYRREGKVATSRELGAAVSLTLACGALFVAAPEIGRGLVAVARYALDRAASGELSQADVLPLVGHVVASVGPGVVLAVAPAAVVTGATAWAANGFNSSSTSLEPDPKRLDPFAGAKNLFLSATPWISLLKGAAIAGFIGWAVVSALREEQASLRVLSGWPVVAQALFLGEVARGVLWRALPAALLVGVADYAWQRYRLSQQMRMSRQDVREEHRETDGDPHLRARRKARARQIALGRTLRDVARADVVVTNPTHYAVALRYRKAENAAPVVLARGVDHMALRIRAEAARHDVPVIENRPLARSLYAQAKVGRPIPKACYGPVAQVLAIVYRRRRSNSK